MKKISRKIFTVVIGCSCISVLLLGNISIFSGARSLRATAEEMLSWMVRDYASGFSNELLLIEDRVRELEVYLQDTIDLDALKSDPAYLPAYEQQLAEYVKNFAERRTTGIAGWCYFNPELSDTPHDVYYVDGNKDGVAERQNYIPLDYYDNTPLPNDDKQWWYGPVETKKGFWTNPYQWTLRDGEVIKVVSYALPVYIEDELIAVVGTYYPFEKMSADILGIKVYETGYASLFNEKLDVIIHPALFAGTRFTSDNLQTVDNGRYSALASQMLSVDYGVSSYPSPTGETNLLAYNKLANGWVLGITPPMDEVFADIGNLAQKLLWAVAVCILLSIVCAWFMGRFISRPLLTVAEGARRIGAGDLTTPVPVTTQDEIATVARSLNEMMENTTRLQGELTMLAYNDELTGGNNLNRFKQLATAALGERGEENYYLVRLDVDGFKLVNDMFGFEDGNIVLCNINHCISTLLLPGEFSARISNDDFILLLQRDSDQEVLDLGKRFADSFDLLHRQNGRSYGVTFSFGVYRVPLGRNDIVTSIDRCTMAHKTAKQHHSGRRYAFYNTEIRNQALKVKSIEDRMQAALEDGEFIIYLQPKFDLRTQQIKGAEALIRWIDPQDGHIIPPIEFIPIFERNGFVAQIDLFVLEEVCKLQREWIDAGLSIVPISVNQSKILLFDKDYISKICTVVDRYSLPHNIIELEILETLIHYNIDALCNTVAALKALDFLVSIDDFGSGYSSLNMLKDIHADVLKIDKEFLNSSEDNTRSEVVLSNIIHMARELQMSVVTEGVETEKQAEMLRGLSCDAAQGYLFARPMPVEDYRRLMD